MKYMFLGILAAYLTGNVYVFVHGWRALHGVSPVLRWLFAGFFWFAALSLFIALFARNLPLPDSFFRLTCNLGSIWMVFVLYMVMSLLIVDLSGGICTLCGKFASSDTAEAVAAALRRWGFCGSVGLVAVLLLYGYINYRNPKVERVRIDLASLADASTSVADSSSRAANTLKIAALSDVHLGYATGKRFLQRYVSLINSLEPDVLLIGGDLIDNSVIPVEKQRMWEELGQLKAPGGIYMVPGNHEYISGIEEVESFLEKTPIVFLRDSVIALPGGVVLVGRDDRSNRGRLGMEELMQRVTALRDSSSATSAVASAFSAAPVILLEHQPYEIAEKASLGIDLQFYGHTHRGQVWPMSLLVDRMFEQSHGYRQWGNSHVIVSEGLSLWGPPFRIGTDSNLFLVTLSL